MGNLPLTTFQDSRTRNVTVDHCLTHSGGWDRDVAFDPMFYDFQVAQGLGVNLPIDVGDIWRFMSSQQSLQFTPGTQFAYSNYGFALIGGVLENRYSRAYTVLMHDKILAPLGLTRPRLGRSILAFRAPGEVRYHPTVPGVATTRLSSSGVWVGRQYGGFNIENMEAHGGYIMAAADYVKIVQALQFGGDRSILDANHRNMLWSGRYPTSTSSTLRGWFRTSLSTGRGTVTTYTHNGSLRGTATLMFHRADGITVAVFLNSDHDGFGNTEMLRLNSQLNAITTWPQIDQFPAVGIPAFGSATAFGHGCIGSNGARLTHTGTDPYLGQTFYLRLTNALPSQFAAGFVGTSDTHWGGIALPASLTPWGAPGCSILIDPASVIGTVTDASGNAAIALGVPSSTSLIGSRVFSQFLAADPAVNALGLTTSNAVEYRVGGN